MTKHTLLATCIVLATAGTAAAGGSEGSIGAGADFLIRGDDSDAAFGGISLNYDMGAFHVGGFLSMRDDSGEDNTDIGFGGRFYYHVHSTAMADFGIGGQIGVGIDQQPGMMGMDGTSDTNIFIEPGIQIRAFVASNVALSFTAGLSIGVADADGFVLGGVPTGGAGVHYYFF